MKVFFASDQGGRPFQQDDGFARAHGDFAALAVFDGMGGMKGGDLASMLAREAVSSAVSAIDFGIDPTRAEQAIEEALRVADFEIFVALQGHGGTTAVVVLALKDWFVVTHIGDSRAYLLRNGALTRLTMDHSDGRYLLRALSGKSSLPDSSRHVRLPGDVILVCSDGLYNELSADRMQKILLSAEDPASALVQAAVDRYADDNVTAGVLVT